MIENNPRNVASAFERLLEEIEAELDFINRMGARAFEAADYEKAQVALGRAAVVAAFRDKIAALCKEWGTLSKRDAEAEDEQTRQEKRDLGRLRKGLRTPESAYYEPILLALLEAGGSAPMGNVLDRVYQLMRGVLTNVDLQPLNSNPGMPRWRNAAQWARYNMMREGLLKADSPRGIWEISAKGRAWLERNLKRRS